MAKVTQVTKAIINVHGASYKMSAILCPISTKLHFPHSGVKRNFPYLTKFHAISVSQEPSCCIQVDGHSRHHLLDFHII
jgi:hypothetical protein